MILRFLEILKWHVDRAYWWAHRRDQRTSALRRSKGHMYTVTLRGMK